MQESIGRCRIREKLGEGAMGAVYAARDESLGRSVAIKTIHREIADDTMRARMWREARAAARVRHPGVCQVYEVGEADGELFIAMELLEGEPLSDRLARGRVPLSQAVGIAIEILEALAAMHRAGVVHRDLKPTNVFLTPHGVKVLDFGVALPLDEEDDEEGRRLTRTGMMVGTPAFMAPEQWLASDVRPAADLFAAGAILVELVTGEPAFRGRTPLELYEAIARDPAPSLTGGPAVAVLDRVAQKALAKLPEDRPPSADTMADELRSVLPLVDDREVPRAQARDLYRAALEEDPRYAPAWARLGRVHRVMAKYGHGDDRADRREAERAFRRALDLNPELNAANHLFAYYEIEELGRPRDALARLLAQARRAPTAPDLLAGLVVACRFCGLLEASVEADRRARRLDPGIRTSVAYTHWMRGDYEEAVRSDDEHNRWQAIYSLPMLGRVDEAIAACRAAEGRATHAIERNMHRATRAALEMDREACAAAVRAVFPSCFHDAEGLYYEARNAVRVGEEALGLEILAWIVDRGFCCGRPLAEDPWLGPLRDDGRLDALLRRARDGHAAAIATYRDGGGEVLLGPADDEPPLRPLGGAATETTIAAISPPEAPR